MENDKSLEEVEAENLKLKEKLAALENESLKSKLAQLEGEARPAPELEPAPVISESQDSDALTPADPKQKKLGSPIKLMAIFVGVIAFSVLLGVAIQLKVIPWYENKYNDNPFSFSEDSAGSISPANTDLLVYTGQAIESANVEQKALGEGESITTPPAFVFNNGKEVTGRRTLDIYLDFGGQKSRDFLLFNRDSLLTLVESGQLELKIHSVISGNPYSVYASEALAEAFVVQPSLAWTLLKDLLILSAEGQVDNWKVDKVAKEFAAKAQEIGIDDIDKTSLQNGTFASWLLSIGNDPRVSQGISLPGLYLDDQPLDTSSLNLNDGTSLYTLLRGELNE